MFFFSGFLFFVEGNKYTLLKTGEYYVWWKRHNSFILNANLNRWIFWNPHGWFKSWIYILKYFEAVCIVILKIIKNMLSISGFIILFFSGRCAGKIEFSKFLGSLPPNSNLIYFQQFFLIPPTITRFKNT